MKNELANDNAYNNDLDNKDIKYAGFWRRFEARTYDGLIFFCINMSIILSFSAVSDSSIKVLIPSLTSFFFTTLFWIKQNGQTPGKRIMKIKIIKDDEGQIDWTTAIIRYIGYFVSGVFLNIGFLWMIVDKKKQTWHDKMAKTYVVEIKNEKPNKFLQFLGIFLPFFFWIAVMTILVFGFMFIFKTAVEEEGGRPSLLFDKDVQYAITSAIQCVPLCSRSQDSDCMKTCFSNKLRKKGKSMNQIREKVRSFTGESNSIRDWEAEFKPEVIQLLKKQSKLRDETNTLTYQKGKDLEYINQVIKLTDERIVLLKKATEIQPENAELWNILGSAYTWQNSGTLEDGLPYVKKAVDLDPNNADFILSLGDLYYRTGDYDKAVLELKKSIRLSPEKAFAYKVLGATYYQMKLTEQAKVNYKKALEIYNKYNQNGQFDKEILQIEKELSKM